MYPFLLNCRILRLLKPHSPKHEASARFKLSAKLRTVTPPAIGHQTGSLTAATGQRSPSFFAVGMLEAPCTVGLIFLVPLWLQSCFGKQLAYAGSVRSKNVLLIDPVRIHQPQRVNTGVFPSKSHTSPRESTLLLRLGFLNRSTLLTNWGWLTWGQHEASPEPQSKPG